MAFVKTGMFQHTAARRRLVLFTTMSAMRFRFQHTAARRRLEKPCARSPMAMPVSTHSRPKAAGSQQFANTADQRSFNTQPPEGGWACGLLVCFPLEVSTHSRPKAAGLNGIVAMVDDWFQHTAARRRLAEKEAAPPPVCEFQHTAARRRLVEYSKV